MATNQSNSLSAPSPVIIDFSLFSFAHFIAKYITTLLRISISLKFFKILIVFSIASSMIDVYLQDSQSHLDTCLLKSFDNVSGAMSSESDNEQSVVIVVSCPLCYD